MPCHLPPSTRDLLVRLFRAEVYRRTGFVEFPHQAEFRLATEGLSLTEQVVEPPDEDPRPFDPEKVRPEDYILKSVPVKVMVPCLPTHPDGFQVGETDNWARYEWRLAEPRKHIYHTPDGVHVKEGVIAHKASDLASFKAGKSKVIGMWATGFACLPGATVDMIGLTYETSQHEFDYLCEALLSGTKPLVKKPTHHYNDVRGGRMYLELPNGCSFGVRSWKNKDALRGGQITVYIFNEIYQLPGLTVYTGHAQNLRAEKGYAVFTSTPDRPWVKKLHQMGHGHHPDWHCPTPDQKILTADLRWVCAGDLKVGDALVGFDEDSKDGVRRFRTSHVTEVCHTKRPVHAVVFSDGTVVKVSGEHQWLAAKRAGRSANYVAKWTQTADGLDDKVVSRYFKPWSNVETRDAGYLASFYDGEGHITKFNHNQPLTVGAAQRGGLTLDGVLASLTSHGFRYRETKSGRDRDADCIRFFIQGSISERARFLGQIRPGRLVRKFHPEMLGALRSCDDRPLVVAVLDLGEQEIAGISTSTHTYILEGFAAHNCSCGNNARVNPFTFDLAGFLGDAPDWDVIQVHAPSLYPMCRESGLEPGALMSKEKFLISWLGQLGNFAGRVYGFDRKSITCTPATHPDLFKSAVTAEWRKRELVLSKLTHARTH